MKKILCLFTILTVSLLSTNAQSIYKLYEASRSYSHLFTLENGQFVSDKNKKSGYAIISIEGMSQKDLFHKMLLSLNKVYMNIDEVVSKIEYDAITVNAYHSLDKGVFTNNGKGYYIKGFQCRFSFKFKDAKLRIEPPIVSTFNYCPILNKELVMKGDIKELGDNASIDLGVNNALRSILLALYDSTKDDQW